MKAFEWCSASSIDEAVKLLGAVTADDEYESPRPLAGGQDLLTTMKEYVVRPKRVVNLKTIPDLANIQGDAASGLKIGPLVTLRQLEMDETVRKSFPAWPRRRIRSPPYNSATWGRWAAIFANGHVAGISAWKM